MILPDTTFLSLVRTKAGPLPGLTCWNSTIVHSWPSITSTSPFLKSAVVATVVNLLDDGQFLGEPGQQFRVLPGGFCRLARHHQRVLDADAAALGQIDAGLHGHHGARE